MKVISVFGSARPQAGEADYVQAQEVGRLLAEAGYAVATGGYHGTMAAVSEGAAAAGGHVIGVTCGQIERMYGSVVNPWVTEEIKYDTLMARLQHLTTQNAGAVVLPGGIGTLAELALTWNLIQCEELTARPFVLLGQTWRTMAHTLFDPAYVRSSHFELVHFADDAAAAVTPFPRMR